jgi:predicted RNA polymerase sigma factor
MDTTLPAGHILLGDTLSRMGRTDEAHKAWEAALAITHQLDPAAQAELIPRLEAKLKK